MSDVKALEVQTINLEEQKIQDEGQALVQMYQAGFLDAWMISNNSFKKGAGSKNQKRQLNIWARISSRCEEAFNYRFMRKIGRNIQKVRGLVK